MSTVVFPPPSRSQAPTDRAKSLLALLTTHSQGDYIGESISQLEHSLQCAHLALKAHSTPSTITAALLHDIGQFVPLSILRQSIKDSATSEDEQETNVGRPNHATLGAKYLTSIGFPMHTCNIVAQHVAAKRYLTSVDAEYMGSLSEASKASLKQQGGPMNAEEREEFERMEGWRECVQVRQWDDAAKVVGIVNNTPRVDAYHGFVEAVLSGGGR